MKKVLIGVGAFVALVVILLTVLIVKDLNQEEKLRQELNEIDSLINFSNFDYDTVNERLGKTISNGDYLVVEKAAKKYLKDTIDIILEIADIMEDETLTSILTAQNYLEDGPNFINSKIYIKNTKEQLENYKTKVLKQFDNETVLSYIENKNLDSYYVDFYKSLSFSSEAEINNNKQDMEESIDSIINMLNVYDEIIDFLIANKNDWVVEDGYIIFENEQLSEEYSNLLLKLA